MSQDGGIENKVKGSRREKRGIEKKGNWKEGE